LFDGFRRAARIVATEGIGVFGDEVGLNAA
jgi:hypothetical protein